MHPYECTVTTIDGQTEKLEKYRGQLL